MPFLSAAALFTPRPPPPPAVEPPEERGVTDLRLPPADAGAGAGATADELTAELATPAVDSPEALLPPPPPPFPLSGGASATEATDAMSAAEPTADDAPENEEEAADAPVAAPLLAPDGATLPLMNVEFEDFPPFMRLSTWRSNQARRVLGGSPLSFNSRIQLEARDGRGGQRRLLGVNPSYRGGPGGARSFSILG